MVISLHNVTPHVHEDSLWSDETPVSSTWDWLAQLFEADFGDGHLEVFAKASMNLDQDLVDCIPSLQAPDHCFPNISEREGEYQKNNPTHTIEFDTSLRRPHTPLRAPPTI